MAGRIHLIREPPNLILFGSGNPYTPKCSPRRPTSLAAAFIYYFAEPIRKVFAESGGHFFKSVLLCGFGSEAPGGNAAGQHGFAEVSEPLTSGEVAPIGDGEGYNTRQGIWVRRSRIVKF